MALLLYTLLPSFHSQSTPFPCTARKCVTQWKLRSKREIIAASGNPAKVGNTRIIFNKVCLHDTRGRQAELFIRSIKSKYKIASLPPNTTFYELFVVLTIKPDWWAGLAQVWGSLGTLAWNVYE
jgi:hypothetical protein